MWRYSGNLTTRDEKEMYNLTYRYKTHLVDLPGNLHSGKSYRFHSYRTKYVLVCLFFNFGIMEHPQGRKSRMDYLRAQLHIKFAEILLGNFIEY